MRTPVVMSWSGGKDCAAALHALLASEKYQVVALLTTVSREFKRISHHGVREELLDAQAAAMGGGGIPLDKILIPNVNGQPCPNDIYESLMADTMRRYKARGVNHVAFGDLFLEDLRALREKNLAKESMTALFPVWNSDTAAFARHVIASGFKARLTCAEAFVGEKFAGREFDLELLHDLPPNIDPCGENGEFHSFVYDGPIFHRPVQFTLGQTISRDNRFYTDLVPPGANPEACPHCIPPV